MTPPAGASAPATTATAWSVTDGRAVASLPGQTWNHALRITGQEATLVRTVDGVEQIDRVALAASATIAGTSGDDRITLEWLRENSGIPVTIGGQPVPLGAFSSVRRPDLVRVSTQERVASTSPPRHGA